MAEYELNTKPTPEIGGTALRASGAATVSGVDTGVSLGGGLFRADVDVTAVPASWLSGSVIIDIEANTDASLGDWSILQTIFLGDAAETGRGSDSIVGKRVVYFKNPKNNQVRVNTHFQGSGGDTSVTFGVDAFPVTPYEG